MIAFSPLDPATWPPVMTVAHVSAIYGTTANAIQHSFKPSADYLPTVPRPWRRYPMKWKKADIVRDLRMRELV